MLEASDSSGARGQRFLPSGLRLQPEISVRFGKPWPFLPPAVQFGFQFDCAWKERIVFKMNMLLEINLEFTESGKKRNVCGAGPLRRLKIKSEAAEFGNAMIGGLMFLHHLGDRMRNRAEAYMGGRIGDDRVL